MLITPAVIYRQRLRDTLREDLPYAFAIFVLGCAIGAALFAWDLVTDSISWLIQ